MERNVEKSRITLFKRKETKESFHLLHQVYEETMEPRDHLKFVINIDRLAADIHHLGGIIRNGTENAWLS